MSQDRNNSALFKRNKAIVMKRDGWTCYMCGGPATEADHLYPQKKAKAAGWTWEMIHSPDNMKAACQKCNRAKSDKVNVQTTYVNPKYRRNK